jgi:hypothetical protein
LNSILKNTISQNIIAFAFIFFAVFLLFHDLFFGKIIATNDVSTNDLLYFNLPVRKLYSDALKNGELLQWTPMIFGGFPVFAEGQGGFLYPINLVLWYLLSPIAAMNLYIILHALLMGLGVYLLVSKLTNNKLLSIPSAVAASVCGSIIAGHTRHMNSLAAIVYAPWLIYTIELFLRTKKVSKGLIFGILLGLMILIGHPQFSFITGFIALFYLFLRIFFEKKTSVSFFKKIIEYRVLYFLLIALVISVIIGFPQLKSTFELLPFTERGTNLSSEFTGLGSLPFNGFLTFIYPYYMGNAGNGTFQSQNLFYFWEFFHYCGVLIFALAILGTVKMWKRTEYHSIIRTLVVIAIISYILSLGENLPLYKIFSLFPFVKSFRFPVRWLEGTEISVLVLSGFGVISLFELIYGKNKQTEKKSKKKTNPSLISTIKDDGKLLSIQYRLAIFLSILVPLEILIVAGRQVATADPAIYLNPPSFTEKIKNENKSSITSRDFTLSRVEFLSNIYGKSHGWEGKQDMFGLGAKLLPDELGAYFGVPIIHGYFLLVPRYIYEVWGDADHSGILQKTASLDQNKFQPTEKFIKLSKLFGVKFLTSIWDIPQPYKKIWDSLGVKAYELPDTLNKAWVVSKTESFNSDNEKLNAESLINDKFDPWRSAYVDGTPPGLPSESQNGTAEIRNYENHSVTIKANAPGFVVLNDTWFPKWKAFIDGNEVPIYKTNVMMRGVVAPRAGTIIEMKYDTGNVFIYTIISYLTIIISIGYLYFEKRKSIKNY